MTKRLTKVIVGTLDTDSSIPLRLRYVTDAGNPPHGYFQSVLRTMNTHAPVSPWSGVGASKQIVDLRTVCRSRLWDRIWSPGLDDYTNLPEANSSTQDTTSAKAA
jgi:hypothetical protein